MKVINSTTIVHSASRNFKEALDLCIETKRKISENIHLQNEKVLILFQKESDLILVIGGDGTMIRTVLI